MAVSLAVVRHHEAAQAAQSAQPTVAQLVCMWLADDPAGWAGLCELFDRSLRRYLLRVTRRPDIVHDLSVDTWLRARRYLRTYDPRRSFEPWLCRIGFNLYMSVWTAGKRRGIEEEASDDSTRLAEHASPGPDTPLYAGCSAADLHRALDHLSRVQAHVAYGHHVLGRSFKELSAELGRDPHTVASDDLRARQHLHARLVARS
jgi:RNA polymerase sigma factor (sigma-70 family)